LRAETGVELRDPHVASLAVDSRIFDYLLATFCGEDREGVAKRRGGRASLPTAPTTVCLGPLAVS
jgi:hypothetical protein